MRRPASRSAIPCAAPLRGRLSHAPLRSAVGYTFRSLDVPAKDLALLLRSRHPLVLCETVEEKRFESLLRGVASELSLPVSTWSAASGLSPVASGRRPQDAGPERRATAHPGVQGRRRLAPEGPAGPPREPGRIARPPGNSAGVRGLGADSRPRRPLAAPQGRAGRRRGAVHLRPAGRARAARPDHRHRPADHAGQPRGACAPLEGRRLRARVGPSGPDPLRGGARPREGVLRRRGPRRRRSGRRPRHETRPRAGRRPARVHPRPGRPRSDRRPGAAQAVAPDPPVRIHAGPGRAAARRAARHPAARRPGLRQEPRGQGRGDRLGPAAAVARCRAAARALHRRIGEEPARRLAPCRAHRPVRPLDRRDRKGLRLDAVHRVRRRGLQARFSELS